MHCETLVPWTTVTGSSSIPDVWQDPEGYLDVGGAPDAVLWVEVARAVPGGSTSFTLTLESSPSFDEKLFSPVAGPISLSPSKAITVVKTAPMAVSVAALARWLRWHVNATGATGDWAVTFRVRVSRSRTPFFSPTMIPGCMLWLRSDLGVTPTSPTSGIVSTWDDQSGSGYVFGGQGTTGPTFGATQINGLNAIGTTIGGVAYLQTASLGGAIAQGDTMVVVLRAAGSQATFQTYVSGGSGGSAQQFSQSLSSTTSVNINAGAGLNQAVTQALTSPSVLQVDWNGASSQIYQNGSPQGSAVNPGVGGIQLGTIGANGAGGQGFTGWFAEVLLFKPILSQANRALITHYLGMRYGIPVL